MTACMCVGVTHDGPELGLSRFDIFRTPFKTVYVRFRNVFQRKNVCQKYYVVCFPSYNAKHIFVIIGHERLKYVFVEVKLLYLAHPII